MDEINEEEYEYFKKIDRRNGVTLEYRSQKQNLTEYSVNSRDGIVDRGLDYVDRSLHSSSSSSASSRMPLGPKKKYTPADFKVKMNSEMDKNKQGSIGGQLREAFSLRASDATERFIVTDVLLKSINSDGRDLSSSGNGNFGDRERSREFVDKEASLNTFRSGGFSLRPYSTTTTTTNRNQRKIPVNIKSSGKRKHSSLQTNIHADDKQGPPTKSAVISKRDDKTTPKNKDISSIKKEFSQVDASKIVHGVAFCDCNCVGCPRHLLYSNSKDKKNKKNPNMNAICYYRSKESKIEYITNDFRWNTHGIDHIQVIEPVIDGLQHIENIHNVGNERVSLDYITQLLETESITPFTVSVFFGTNADKGDLCFTRLQNQSTSSSNSNSSSTTKTEIMNLARSNINTRICLNKCHTENIDIKSLNQGKYGEEKSDSKGKMRHICVIIESRTTTDERIVIRTCLIYTHSNGNTAFIPESRFKRNIEEMPRDLPDERQENSNTKRISEKSQILLKILGGSNQDGEREENEEKIDTLLRLVLEFNNSNNPDVVKSIAPDLLSPSFFVIEKLEQTDSSIGNLWGILKKVDIWTYTRTFLIMAPSI